MDECIQNQSHLGDFYKLGCLRTLPEPLPKVSPGPRLSQGLRRFTLKVISKRYYINSKIANKSEGKRQIWLIFYDFWHFENQNKPVG